MANDYSYPEFPNQQIRDNYDRSSRLRYAPDNAVQYEKPSQQAIQNAVPNRYAPEGTQEVPGTQNFGVSDRWFQMPQDQDIIHREINLRIDEPLLYRQNLGTPRHESASRRVFAPSVTTPSTNAAQFINGKVGDVYGG